jgi:glycerophosphoryl diester phosphodiesterase
MFENYPSPMVFGHRGACALAPENTIPSFELAIEQGADAIELDVKLTADNQAVVIHDETVERTTDGKGFVNQLSLSEIKKLDAGKFFNEKFAGVRIPTLSEVFESLGKRILIDVELTNYFSPTDDLIPIVAAIVKNHQMQTQVFFSSFLPQNLDQIRQLLPHTPAALLCQGGSQGILARSAEFLNTSPELIHPNLSDVNQQFVKIEHERGRRINVYTVNKDADILRMRDLGVDGIFTDNPLNALTVLGRK